MSLNFFETELGKQLGTVLGSVVATLFAGMGIRKVASKDARDRAKAKAEETYFDTAVGKMEKERDTERLARQKAEERVAELEDKNTSLQVLNATLESQLMFQRRILNRYPELRALFESEPMPFDDRPIERSFPDERGDG